MLLITKGDKMPTLVKFAGGESFTLAEDFDTVNQLLSQHQAGLFDRVDDGDRVRVTVYRANIAFIQEEVAVGEGNEPFVLA